MKNYDKKNLIFVVGASLCFSLTSCGSPPVSGHTSDQNTDAGIPEAVKKLSNVGINLSKDQKIVGSSLAQAWCRELKAGQRPFGVYEFSPFSQENETGYDSLLKDLVDEYVGEDPEVKDNAIGKSFSKKIEKMTKKLVADKGYGKIDFFTIYGQTPPTSSSPVDKSDLFAKVRTFVGKNMPAGISETSYFVVNFDEENGSSEGGNSTGYEISLQFMDKSVPFSDASLTTDDLTRAVFHFNAKGELDGFQFVPGAYSKSTSFGQVDVLSPEKALEKAKAKAGIDDLGKYEVACYFDYQAAESKDQDKKIYFIPTYSFLFKPKSPQDSEKGKEASVSATEDSRVRDKLNTQKPNDANPDGDK